MAELKLEELDVEFHCYSDDKILMKEYNAVHKSNGRPVSINPAKSNLEQKNIFCSWLMKAAEQQQSYQDNQVKPQITYHKELKLYTIRYFYPVKLFNRAEIRLITDGVPIKKVTCFKNRENKILIEKEHPWKIKKKIENGYRETPKEKKEQKNYLLVSSRDSFFENCQQRFEELYNQSQESLNTLTNNLSKMIKSFSP